MPRITFIAADGTETVVDAGTGDSLMQVARAHNVDGILAECGGEMMCSTCHVYVEGDWLDRTGAADEDERDMLDFAPCEITDASRLSCQVKITEDMDGLVVRLPERQV